MDINEKRQVNNLLVLGNIVDAVKLSVRKLDGDGIDTMGEDTNVNEETLTHLVVSRLNNHLRK